MFSVSVVIPALNEEAVLGACLESLHAQSVAPYEIIVVDNGSKDKTKQVAHRYGATVVDEPKRGIMAAVHTGMTKSTGNIIARCDADSILPADWIETIMNELDKHPDAAGVTGPGSFYGTSSLSARAAHIWYMYSYFILTGSALANWPLFGSNCAIRRSTWESIKENLHRDRTDIHDDMDMSIHIAPTQRILFRPSLKVQISARSLKLNGLDVRYKRGVQSLRLHWPEQSPWRRWRARILER